MVEQNSLTELLTVEGITIFGVLLSAIVLLLYYIKSLKKEHATEKAYLRSEIRTLTETLKDEYENSTKDLKDIIGKYYVLVTKIAERLKNHD